MQQLEMQETRSRCTLDPDCSMEDAFRNLQDPRGQKSNNFWRRAYREIQQYQSTMGEREAITSYAIACRTTCCLNDSKAGNSSPLCRRARAMHREAAQQDASMNDFGMAPGSSRPTTAPVPSSNVTRQPGSTVSGCANALHASQRRATAKFHEMQKRRC